MLLEQTINVPSEQGSIVPNPAGRGQGGFYGKGLCLIDSKLQGHLQKLKQIQPNALPLFLSYDVFIGCGGGCAIGEYHSALAGPPNDQTYSFSAVIDPDSSPEDVGALSHEFGEWLLDPFIDNPGCGGLREVGDSVIPVRLSLMLATIPVLAGTD
jgi:hypothetical protein